MEARTFTWLMLTAAMSCDLHIPGMTNPPLVGHPMAGKSVSFPACPALVLSTRFQFRVESQPDCPPVACSIPVSLIGRLMAKPSYSLRKWEAFSFAPSLLG